MVVAKKKQDKPFVIKKYANRRLYDTERSSYVTLDDLCETIKEGYDFVVYDAKTGEDLTRSVLTQIIFDQESKGQNLLPVNFLRQLIGLYGGSGGGADQVVPNYLEYMMDLFSKNQETIKNQINTSFEASKQGMKNFEGFFPVVPTLEDVKRQNFAMMEKAMQMFSPFGTVPGMPSMQAMAGMGGGAAQAGASSSGFTGDADRKAAAERVKALQQSMAEMEKELRRLSSQL